LDGYSQAREDAVPWHLRDRFGMPISFEGIGMLHRIARIILVNLGKLI
jgi:hypothetical protein